MSNYYIEKAILATTYKIERVKRETGIFKRNKWATIGAGALITIIGPNYTDNDPGMFHQRSSRNALEMSDMSYLHFSITLAFFYSAAIIIAHLTWTAHDRRKIKKLEKRKAELEKQLV